jgi:hypothetical protein
MRRSVVRVFVLAVLAIPAAAAGGSNRVYLVPALAECPGPASCPRVFESGYTFDTIILRTPPTKFTPPGKPAFVLDVRGVRDPAGALLNGNLTLRVLSGRVSVPGIGTFQDDSPLTRVAPVPIPIKNGNAKRFPYDAPESPNGTITNGGGVEVLDPDGKRLAVTGSQAKP